MFKKPIQEQEIIELLKSNYGLEIQSVQLLQLGADNNAFVYKANAKSNSYFVKIKYGNHEETHIAVIRFLHDSNLKEIIFPKATTDGELFKQLNHFKIIVYPFIEGHNGFEQQLTKNQWIELGKTLKKIHTLSIPVSIQEQVRKETFSSKWRESVRSFYPKIEPISSDDVITTEFKQFFKEKLDATYRLVNSAEKLSKTIQQDPSKSVLCHADIHAGNVLITSDGSFYIVDWDDPIMAPKERDLMFIGGGVGNVWNVPNEIAYFYEGYSETHIDQTILSYYRHERIVEDIAVYTHDILSNTHDEQSKLISLHHFKSMFEPNGVVDIAFASA